MNGVPFKTRHLRSFIHSSRPTPRRGNRIVLLSYRPILSSTSGENNYTEHYVGRNQGIWIHVQNPSCKKAVCYGQEPRMRNCGISLKLRRCLQCRQTSRPVRAVWLHKQVLSVLCSRRTRHIISPRAFVTHYRRFRAAGSIIAFYGIHCENSFFFVRHFVVPMAEWNNFSRLLLYHSDRNKRLTSRLTDICKTATET